MNYLLRVQLVVFLLICIIGKEVMAQSSVVRISTFDVDATPPVGSYLAYDKMEAVGELGLRARGIVLEGAGLPIVLCAIDWIGIANGSQDFFKAKLAKAAGTVPERVSIHTVHQHDAPISDFSAEQILKSAGIEPQSYESTFQRKFVENLSQALKIGMERSTPITHIGYGEAEVYEVASNRRIIGADGKAQYSRTSATKDPNIRAFPEGVIDPNVSLLSFWENEKPVAVFSYYAVHPQSYYLTKIANPDFPGIARFLRQLEVPDALHVHFNGAGANVTAGKFNDGSKENRLVLAQRLADGMKRAWESTVKTPITAEEIDWKIVQVDLPVVPTVEAIRNQFAEKDMRWRTNYLQKLAWKDRVERGYATPISCLYLGNQRVLHLPGELFVEYQLLAKKHRPELKIHMAAYADYGPFYIGTAQSYQEGGYEITTSPTTAEAEPIISQAIKSLLDYVPDTSRLSEVPELLINDGQLISSTEGWDSRRTIIREKMEIVMGKLPARDDVQPPKVHYLDTLNTETYRRFTVRYESHSDNWVPAYLYIPHSTENKPVPAIIALHSTGAVGKGIVDGQSDLENRAVGKELATRGYVVLAPDYPSFGDLTDYSFDGDGFESGTMVGIWNHMRGVDLVSSLPEVDESRLGVIGHSLGGHNAIFLGSFDDRLGVVVSSCGWTPFDYYNIGEEAAKRYGGRLGPWAQDRYMPKVQNYLPDYNLPFDFPDMISSLAPRAFFSSSPLQDSNFDVEGVKEAMKIIRPVFEHFNAENNLKVLFPDAGHDFPPEIRTTAYEFIDNVLKFKPANSSF